MITVVDVGLAVLCALVALETLALKAIFAETRGLDDRYRSDDVPSDLLTKSIGANMPAFSLRVLDSTELVTDHNMQGQFTIVLFVTRTDVTNLGRDVFLSLVHGLASQSDECLHVVCEGSDDDCRWIRDNSGVHELFGDNVRMLVDPEAGFRAIIGIVSTPTGIAFDEAGKLLKVGTPVMSAERHPA